MLSILFTNFTYLTSFILLFSGLTITFLADNLMKKIIGLSIAQTSVLLFFIAIGKLKNAAAPIMLDLSETAHNYSNPVPHVLMLTAIVVGVSILAFAIVLIIKVKKKYNTIEYNTIIY